MSDPARPLAVVTGCTASGKEAAAAFAARILGAEIVCADSVKPYRGLAVAAAAPPIRAEGPRHHLVGVLDPAERLDAAGWGRLATAAIAEIEARGARPLVVGGTALYLRAFLFGMFDGPPPDRELRARLTAEDEAAPGSAHAKLREVDPAAAARLHPNDRKRVVRALEVHALTGRPLSEVQNQWTGPPRVPYVGIGLRRTREDLRARIDARIDRMLRDGLVDEIRALAAPGRLGPTAVDAIGVKELLPALRRELGTGVRDPAAIDAAVAEIRRNTWTFARRQQTWWRSFPGITWLDVAPDEPAELTGERIAALLA